MLAVILVPGIFALIIGAAMFKRRVGGTYFAIITQAVAAILTILIVGQQGYTGGINGMTDLRTLKGWDIRPDHAKVVLYFFEVGLLFVCIFIAQFIRHSKLGRILVAMREQEDRVRFSGYSVANFKIFAFCVGAVFAAIGGAMFALQVGFMSPSFVGIVPSIEMVIYTAVGGRLSILGAVYGTLLVNFAKTSLSESFPELWLFGLGGLFIAVVLAFPNGLAGIWRDYVQPRIDRLICVAQAEVRERLDRQFRRRRRAGRVRRTSCSSVINPNLSCSRSKALTVSFDGFKAVNDLSFYVEENEIRVIIGPNGAGKTTVLDLICGKTKATSGSIEFRGKELTKLKENQIVQAGVGRKFQTPSIYDDLTVFENLEISFPRGRTVFGALTFTRDATVRDRVQEVAEMIFLKDRLDMSADLLSHGQKQWLEIGMLLIQDPDLLMLDEPVAGMSVSERAKTAELLNRIIKDRSVLVIEHDMKFVEDIAHKVTVLHQGQILSEGTMEQVKNDPKVIEVYLGPLRRRV